MPDPPPCNAPAPKAAAGGDGEEGGEGGDADEPGGAPKAEGWSGDDEDLLDAAGKVGHVLGLGGFWFP